MGISVKDKRVPDAADCVLRYILEKHAASQPDKVFVHFEDGSEWTYAETLSVVRRTAAGLQQLGVQQGDHVLSWLPNGPDALRVWFAINYIGAVCVPINLAYRGNLLAHVIDNSDAKVIIAHADLVERLDDIPIARLEAIVALKGKPASKARLALHDDKALDGDETNLKPLARDIAPWDLQCIMYTSGTTGPSKGVRSSYLHLYSVSAEPYHFTNPEDRYLINLPLFHVGGTVAVYVMLIRGGSVAIVESFRASEFWKVVNEGRATIATLLGSMTPLISKAPPSPDDAKSTLRVGLMIPLVEDARKFGERFGCEIYTLFNMTEVSIPILSELYPSPVGTCGKAREGMTLRIVDANDCEVAPGEVGELVVRADRPWALSDGYYKDDAATARAWRNGWFHTGDAFRQDEKGNFFFVDRMKDTIRRRGENISSFEVETEVAAHPNVKEAAVVAVRDEIGEEEVMAVIALKEPAAFDPFELVEFLKPRLPHFMVPRYFRVVDELPKTPTQKIQKHVLREQGTVEGTWDREAHGLHLKRQKLAT